MSWAFPPIRRVSPSPRSRRAAAQRFFKRGDIVVEINGVTIENVDMLREALGAETRLWRIAIDRGGRILKLTVGG